MKKNNKNKAKKYYLIAYGFKTFGFLMALVPLIILFCINRERYFSYKNTPSITIGLIILAIGVIIVLAYGTKVLNKYTLLVFSTILTWCFKAVIDDIAWMLLCALIGCITFDFINIFAKYYFDLAKTWRNANINAKVHFETEREYQ